MSRSFVLHQPYLWLNRGFLIKESVDTETTHYQERTIKDGKKKTQILKYGAITLKGIQYYRTRITDADGKELSLYAATCEELYEKQLEARKKVEEIIFHRQHPTVAEYGKWLLMQSAKVSASTLRGYTRIWQTISSNLWERCIWKKWLLTIFGWLLFHCQKSEGLYNKVNMLLKCIFMRQRETKFLNTIPVREYPVKAENRQKRRRHWQISR